MATEGPAEAYISFSSPVNEVSTAAATEGAIQAVEAGVQRIVLCLATLGGEFPRAVSLGNFLRGLPVRFDTFNTGLVASAGIALFLAGEDRFAAPGATFGFHPSSIHLEGSFNPAQLAARRALLIADDESEERIIVKRTALTRAEARAIVQGSRKLSDREALRAGIVQQVKDLKMPAGAMLLSA